MCREMFIGYTVSSSKGRVSDGYQYAFALETGGRTFERITWERFFAYAEAAGATASMSSRQDQSENILLCFRAHVPPGLRNCYIRSCTTAYALYEKRRAGATLHGAGVCVARMGFLPHEARRDGVEEQRGRAMNRVSRSGSERSRAVSNMGLNMGSCGSPVASRRAYSSSRAHCRCRARRWQRRLMARIRSNRRR